MKESERKRERCFVAMTKYERVRERESRKGTREKRRGGRKKAKEYILFTFATAWQDVLKPRRKTAKQQFCFNSS